jgi:hypothetical protein
MRESEGSKSGKDWPRGIVGTQASGDGGGGRFGGGGSRSGGGGRSGCGGNVLRGARRRKFIGEEAAREEKGRHNVARRSSEATRRVASSSSRVGQCHQREASHSSRASRGERPLSRWLGSDAVPQIFWSGANPNIGRIF